ncbi:hypothetical protein ACFVYD_33300 [Streptomyces sp. NPDC058301]|uniref:hypothetical protein n=1 Tax=Streptomyces sp. NPDC058301 TaxID=3346436 RepID=UPI0036ED5227
MAIRRARKALFTGIAGIAALSGTAATFAVAQAAPRSSAPAAVRALDTADMPSAVEDFAYPNAAKILQEQKITLKRGDGHITLTDCQSAHDIEVRSRTAQKNFCFAVSSKQGYLTMELPDAFGMWTEDHPVRATITAGGNQTVIDAPKNDYTPMGEGDVSKQRSVLVDLRVTG